MPGTEQMSGVQRLLGDLIELCELQWQLLSVDGEEAKRRLVSAAIFLVVGLVVAAVGIMAGVLSIGWLLHDYTELSVGVSFALTALIALVVAGMTAYIGARKLSNANESLSETKREFGENVRWLKAVIVSPKTSARNQLRTDSFTPENVPAEESRFQHIY